MERINKVLENATYRRLLILGSALPAIAPMYFLGIYNGPDITQHFQFADTFERAILAGDFYPSWGAFENLGYGSVGVRFYPPLFSFSLAVFHLLTKNWHLAVCLVFLFYSVLGSIGVYLTAKEFLPAKRAFWAAPAFSVMPYHLAQIYNVSVYAEFAACSILAFCFLFAVRTNKRGNLYDVIGLSAAYGILILTHLPTAVIGSLCLLVYGLTTLSKDKAWMTLCKFSTAALLGLAASSVYWLRMIFELEWMRHTKFRTDVVFDYKQNFLLTASWFDGRQYWFLNIIFLVMTAMIGTAYWSLLDRNHARLLKNLRGLKIVFFFSVFMAVFISQPVWMILPFIQEVQFPFRWLTVSVVSGAIIVAAGVEPFYNFALSNVRREPAAKAAAAVLMTGLIAVFSLAWISVSNSHIPARSFDAWVDQTRTSMGFDFFWTTYAHEKAFSITEKVSVAGRRAAVSDWQPYDRTFRVDAGLPADARIATLFYPHWRAYVNNEKVETKIAEDGTLTVPLPEEKAEVRVLFEEPFYLKAAGYITLFVWLAFAAIIFYRSLERLFRVVWRRSPAQRINLTG